MEKGLSFIAVEGDWPDTYRINRFVRGFGTLEDALSEFNRFPRWMWRNEVIRDFIQWLKEWNEKTSDPKKKVGFYGLDLYSLYESAHEVIEYLRKVDPEAAKRATMRYSCFDHYGKDSQAYGYAAAFGLSKSCEEGVKRQLIEMLQRSANLMKSDFLNGEELFFATENAKVVKDAEEYYRCMFSKNTWDMRDKHMVSTVTELLDFFEKHYQTKNPKAVIWAHNSHLGDASAEEEQRHTNIGELARAKFGLKNTFNIGFTTYEGTVTAADDWDSPGKRKRVRPGLKNSYEELLRKIDNPWYYLLFRSNSPQITIDKELVKSLDGPKLERAIGVIYRPDTERQSHYFLTSLPNQFDCVIHIDRTSALRPLDAESYIEEKEPETYPFGV
jgi:erythromycin esterase-like protein